MGAAVTPGPTEEPAPQPTEDPTPVPTEEPTPVPTEEPSPPPTQRRAEPTEQPAEPRPLPSRAEMDNGMRIRAELHFVKAVRDKDVGRRYRDYELVIAGDVACDAMDVGKPIPGILMDVTKTLPGLENPEATAILARVASGFLCPEHAPD